MGQCMLIPSTWFLLLIYNFVVYAGERAQITQASDPSSTSHLPQRTQPTSTPLPLLPPPHMHHVHLRGHHQPPPPLPLLPPPHMHHVHLRGHHQPPPPLPFLLLIPPPHLHYIRLNQPSPPLPSLLLRFPPLSLHALHIHDEYWD